MQILIHDEMLVGGRCRIIPGRCLPLMVHSEAFQYTHVNQPQLFVNSFDCYFGRVSMYNVVPFQLLDISEPPINVNEF